MNSYSTESLFHARIWQLYEHLERATQDGQLDLCKYSYPFVPYVGRRYGKTAARILYIGKETNGWGEDTRGKTQLCDAVKERVSMEELLRITDDFLRESIEDYYGGLCESNKKGGKGYPCAFWKTIYQLTASIITNAPCLMSYREIKNFQQLSSDCFSSIAWTNVFKIGGAKTDDFSGRSDRKMRNFLMERFMTLPDEIYLLNPDLVVFTTGTECEDYLRDIFPNWNASIVHGSHATIEGIPIKALVVRTRHPQGMSNKELGDLYEMIRRGRNH